VGASKGRAQLKDAPRSTSAATWSISSHALRALQRVANEVERIINPPPEDNVVAIRSPCPYRKPKTADRDRESADTRSR
jgi:hypothetical protein